MCSELILIAKGYNYADLSRRRNYFYAPVLPDAYKPLLLKAGCVTSAHPYERDNEDTTVLRHYWPLVLQRCSRADMNKKGQLRVMCIGCSFTEGYGIRDEDTFCWKLNDRYANIVFDNCGTGGYGTYQSYLRMETELKNRQYDLVIYFGTFDHCFREIPGRITGNLCNQEIYFLRPSSDIKNGKLVLRPADSYFWPGEFRFLTIDYLKRIYCGINFVRLQKYWHDFVAGRREGNCDIRFKDNCDRRWPVYVGMLRQMRDTAVQYGAKFVLASHDGNPPEGCVLPVDVNVFSAGFPSHDPKYHVKGLMKNHPNELANTLIANSMAKWIDDNMESLLSTKHARRTDADS